MNSIDRWLPTLIAVPLIGFALYRRFNRAFRRQRVAPGRMIFRMALLSLIGGVILCFAPARGLAAAGAGALVGTGLALFSLARTKLEPTADGLFFTPHKWTELGVMAIFLGRLAGRMLVVYQAASAQVAGAPPDPALQRSPLTIGLFFLLAAYYVVNYGGLLKRARAQPAVAPTAA